MIDVGQMALDVLQELWQKVMQWYQMGAPLAVRSPVLRRRRTTIFDWIYC